MLYDEMLIIDFNTIDFNLNSSLDKTAQIFRVSTNSDIKIHSLLFRGKNWSERLVHNLVKKVKESSLFGFPYPGLFCKDTIYQPDKYFSQNSFAMMI